MDCLFVQVEDAKNVGAVMLACYDSGNVIV